MKKYQVLILIIFYILPCICEFELSFDAAMHQSQYYKSSNSGERWQIFRQWYSRNLQNAERIETPLIPKIIHQIWLGSPFPDKCKKFQESWINNHPDWEYKLWTDEDVAELKLINQHLYDETSNYGSKSDIARYEILYRFGGLYIDTDFECIKPFDVFHETVEFYTGVTYDPYAAVFNGLIAAAPGHPILKKCIETMQSNHKRKESVDQIMKRTGPYHLTECIFSAATIESEKIVAIPVAYFYPWPHYIKNPPNPYSYLKPESFAIHHWHVSWR